MPYYPFFPNQYVYYLGRSGNRCHGIVVQYFEHKTISNSNHTYITVEVDLTKNIKINPQKITEETLIKISKQDYIYQKLHGDEVDIILQDKKFIYTFIPHSALFKDRRTVTGGGKEELSYGRQVLLRNGLTTWVSTANGWDYGGGIINPESKKYEEMRWDIYGKINKKWNAPDFKLDSPFDIVEILPD